ncbi:MAG TPA: hypothetical protein VF228_17385 [Iamia sp.]
MSTTRRPRFTSYRHQANIETKAQRCMPLLEEWAANLVAQNDGLTMSAAYAEIKAGLTGPEAETFWTMLGEEHGKRYPHYAGRKGFHSSRGTILAKLEARSWVADPAPADAVEGRVG